MNEHPVVSNEEWTAARIELLKKEKQFTQMRDELTKQRRNLPWEKVEKEYTFDGPNGKLSLADLFEDCSQLIVYHFMYGPDWPEGCKICSMLGDHYDPLTIHLKHRDVSLVTVSRAPISNLIDYKQRMGWSFNWVSSYDSDFNWDYHVSFKKEDLEGKGVYYNYEETAQFPADEGPGISSFFKNEKGEIFHTYSSFGRGLENFLGIYNFLDIVTKGRDESEFPYPMAWVRHKDQYGDSSVVDPYI